MRKFYFSDPVRVVGSRWINHQGHLGNITETKIVIGPKDARRTTYSIDCSCGKSLSMPAHQLEPASYTETGTLREKRLRHLFLTVGIPCPELNYALESKANTILKVLNKQYREIIERRFGIIPGPQSYQGIADLMNISKQRVHYVAGQAIQRMQREFVEA